MKKTLITGLLGATLALVAACGPLQEGNRAVSLLSGVFGSLSGADDSPSEGGVAMTRAVIEAQEADLLRVSIISRDATAILLKVATNGSKVTWASQDGLSLAFDRGLLVASRGFGDDLMGTDISSAVASLRGGGNHLRTLDFLNGLDEIERRTFQCSTVVTGSESLTIVERTYQTTVLEETCTDSNFGFKNTYWRDRDGTIWQSRQWISVQTGYLGYQRL
ncbi:YjbF family lipoprotein [Octadecabacter sp. G9-8]|uniref:YjbF family lipoprotein n=1 Tax=Octadecabacter dasysiphoniae TaxID=2909341 RepID=A0ABS9CYT9_9RHOB|nr:YjbF family lipoprotein [Octadecabacter dasysiphoniae]MCF2871336.1 YjbF family lipoprotein [Octadecabacter dasysiphoniae]